MKKNFLVFCVLPSAFVGCDRKADETTTTSFSQPASQPASQAASQPANVEPGSLEIAPKRAEVPVAPESFAENAKAVTRYPNEQRLGIPSPVNGKKGTVIRMSPLSTAESVTMLNSGHMLQEVSEYNGYYLVLFNDPKNPARRLSGWVPREDVIPAVESGPSATGVHGQAGVKSCENGWVLAKAAGTLTKDTCVQVCQGDADCKAGEACNGMATTVDKGVANDNSLYCVGKAKK